MQTASEEHDVEQMLNEHQQRTVRLAAQAQSDATGALIVLEANNNQTKMNLDEYMKLELGDTLPIQQTSPPAPLTSNPPLLDTILKYSGKTSQSGQPFRLPSGHK